MTIFREQRRGWLRDAAGLALGGAAGHAPAVAQPAGPDWDALAASYALAGDVVNLENGYYGVMAAPVAEDYKRNIDHLNRHNSRFLRNEFDGAGLEAIRAQLAAHAGAAVDEIAITRSATESLQKLISNYRPLGAGDMVMYGNLDYDSVTDAMNDLARRRGAGVARVVLPEPASRGNVVEAYERALRAHPRTKLLLLTHVSHRTGLVVPVAEVVALARRRSVDVVVDVAHSWGQLDYRIPDFGADFVGANLHKWVGAPLGLGFLYVRRGRLQDIGVEQGNSEYPDTDIRARVHPGTLNVAALMTIPAALAFHARVPLAQRAARLRALRDYWVRRVLDVPGMQMLTPEEDGMYGAVTSFRFAGRTSFEANAALARRLADDYGIFTVARSGPAGGSCIRVTPSWFTRTEHLDRLAAALRDAAAAPAGAA